MMKQKKFWRFNIIVKEIARYGKFKTRDAPKDDKPIDKPIDKPVSKQQPYNPDKLGIDILNQFARYGI